jgi:amino acid transporter
VNASVNASVNALVRAAERPAAPRLRRELGVLGLAATGICSMVGAGINIVPFAIQRTVPGIGDWVLPAYAIAAVPAVLAALCYAALGSAMPRAGGSYVYASRAINAHAGFLASFSQWFGLCMAIGVVAYVIPPFLRDIAVAAGWDGVAAALGARAVRLALALALLWAFVLVNLRGVDAVARTLVPLMVLMFVCGGMVIVTGASHDPADYATLLASRGEAVPLSVARGGFWAVVPAGAAVLFSSFIGFDAIAQAGGEARHPSRSIPLAVAAAIVTVGAFYFAFTWAVYHAVPWQVVAEASGRGDVTAPGLLTPLVSAPVALLMVSGAAVSLINDLPGMLLGVSRLCFAWAEDGVFPARLAAVHPRHHTPHVALGVSALLATASVLGGHFANDFFVGVDILVTAMLVNFLFMAVSLLRLPSRNPALAAELRLLRTPLARRAVAIPAIGMLAVLLVAQTWRDLSAPGAWYAHPTWIWVVVMVAGGALHLREVRRLRAQGVDLAARTMVLPPE